MTTPAENQDDILPGQQGNMDDALPELQDKVPGQHLPKKVDVEFFKNFVQERMGDVYKRHMREKEDLVEITVKFHKNGSATSVNGKFQTKSRQSQESNHEIVFENDELLVKMPRAWIHNGSLVIIVRDEVISGYTMGTNSENNIYRNAIEFPINIPSGNSLEITLRLGDGGTTDNMAGIRVRYFKLGDGGSVERRDSWVPAEGLRARHMLQVATGDTQLTPTEEEQGVLTFPPQPIVGVTTNLRGAVEGHRILAVQGNIQGETPIRDGAYTASLATNTRQDTYTVDVLVEADGEQETELAVEYYTLPEDGSVEDPRTWHHMDEAPTARHGLIVEGAEHDLRGEENHPGRVDFGRVNIAGHTTMQGDVEGYNIIAVYGPVDEDQLQLNENAYRAELLTAEPRGLYEIKLLLEGQGENHQVSDLVIEYYLVGEGQEEQRGNEQLMEQAPDAQVTLSVDDRELELRPVNTDDGRARYAPMTLAGKQVTIMSEIPGYRVVSVTGVAQNPEVHDGIYQSQLDVGEWEEMYVVRVILADQDHDQDEHRQHIDVWVERFFEHVGENDSLLWHRHEDREEIERVLQAWESIGQQIQDEQARHAYQEVLTKLRVMQRAYAAEEPTDDHHQLMQTRSKRWLQQNVHIVIDYLEGQHA